MHPSCALIVWIAAVCGAQFVGYRGLCVLAALPLLLAPLAWRSWLAYVRRARWLLLTLWLILAYGAPGEAWMDWPWAPTREGLAEGMLQVARLLVVLFWLAWLFVAQGRQGLVSGLWGLLLPFRSIGLEVERLVVRLSLVLDNLQASPRPGAWRKILHVDAFPVVGPASLSLSSVPWRWRDSVVVLICLAVLTGVWVR